MEANWRSVITYLAGWAAVFAAAFFVLFVVLFPNTADALVAGAEALFSRAAGELFDAIDALRPDPQPTFGPVDERDLAAQVRMADAAEALLVSSWVQVIVGALGTLGLFLTLWATMRASHNQVRAYLAISMPTLAKPIQVGDYVHIKVEVKNAGATQAYRVRPILSGDVVLATRVENWSVRPMNL